MAKVVHLTSVHPANDTRIFHKECRTLAAAGYDVVLVVPHDRDEVVQDVRIRAVPKPQNRRERITSTVRHVYRAAIAENADLYHFHDPELIPVGLLLARNRPVIYDVHEDYTTSIRQKAYLPFVLRPLLARLLDRPEKCASRFFKIILAEKYYATLFPGGTTVLNYPIKDYFAGFSNRRQPIGLLYTGVVGVDRGALQYAEIVARMEDIRMYIVGRCSQHLASKMWQIAGQGKDRLHIEGIGVHTPYQRILEYYAQSEWTAGLAIYPPTPHYVKKEPTKLFEYMAAGIPIVCSDFPVWRTLIEDTGSGLCVDPLDPNAIVGAIRHLMDHAQEAQEMAQNGRHAFETQYNWDHEARKLVELYNKLLQ